MIKRAFIFGFALAILFSSCGNEQNGTNSEKQDKAIDASTLGVVKSDVMNNDENLLGEMPEYSKAAPGTAERYERSFENAPPMIPHMTDGFFPITKDNNICLSCHMPNVAPATGAVAIPESHFTNYRPDVKKVGDKYAVDAKEGEVVAKKLENLSPARFNCSQCHVPQANVTVDIKNTFERVFRDTSLKKKSNLNQTIKEGVK